MIELWPYLLAVLVAIMGGAYGLGRKDGNTKATNVSLKKEAAAKDEILEMHREATKAEIEAARLSDEEARKEALKWAGR